MRAIAKAATPVDPIWPSSRATKSLYQPKRQLGPLRQLPNMKAPTPPQNMQHHSKFNRTQHDAYMILYKTNLKGQPHALKEGVHCCIMRFTILYCTVLYCTVLY